jgi:hypothetical protein
MSAVDLLQPILDGGLERNNFFNGRLLSAEDLRTEQAAARTQAALLARAAGDGVGWGLGVSVLSAGPVRPRVTVKRGFALNRLGDLLHLAGDAEVAFVPGSKPTDVGAGLFAACEDPPPTASLSGEGAYVLVIAPTSGYRGTAPVSDPNTTVAGRGACGARFNVEGVRFRLVPVALSELEGIGDALRARVIGLMPQATAAKITARERVRNLLAHLCFGTQELGFADPAERRAHKPARAGWGALDAMRSRGDLTDCDVPLALVVLADARISFLDMWAVRRKLVDAAAVDAWRGVAGPRRLAEGEATFLQFQSQLEVLKGAASPPGIAASSYLDVLPAGGWLPAGPTGFDWKTFLGPHAPPAATPIDAALLRGILERSWLHEPFALATSPPVPVSVYEVPEQAVDGSFVVFARSPRGNLRVFLTPAPAATEAVEVTATAANGRLTRATTRSGGTVPVTELVPGPHRVSITAPDYEAVTPRDVEAVGGRTVDLNVTLVPLPNGSILVDPIDKETGERIRRVQSVGASDGNLTRAGVRQSDGQWLIEDLPAATYGLTGRARDYLTATKAGVGPTARGVRLDTVLVFQAQADRKEPPPKCVSIAEAARPPLPRVRLCVVLVATEFEDAYYYGAKQPGPRKLAVASGKFRTAKRAQSALARRAERYPSATGELLYSVAPWRGMVPLEPEPAAVREWLHQWREWFADELEDEDIRKATPVVYIDPNFRPAREAREVPRTPPGYAVFRRFAVPLSIKPEERVTRAWVLIEKAGLRGIPVETLKHLYEAEIASVDDLGWSWEELIGDATGDPPDAVRYLIADAAAAIGTINGERRYYDGMDDEVAKVLKDLGILDDVALANADAEKLGDKLGSRGFAVRLIQKARGIVPRESWSLEGLGLTPHQMDGLSVRGLESKGAVAAAAGRADGRAAIVEALGLEAEAAPAREAVVGALANEAVMVMTRSSIALAPQPSLAMWSGVDATTAAKLGRAGFVSVEDLAAADPAAVATAANIPADAADALVTEARGASRAGLAVGLLAPVTKTEERNLRDLLGADQATVGVMAGKSPAQLAAAFGGNLARATAVLNGIRAGLAAGRFR